MADEEAAPGAAPSKATPSDKDLAGSRLSSVEDQARRADERLQGLERRSTVLRKSVDMLADATGELRRQSAEMRQAALRVAEAVKVASERSRGRRGRNQLARRPPATK